MRRDVLAAGAHKAQFAQGTGDTDYSRNLYKGPEEDTPAVEFVPPPVKRRKFTPMGKTILVRRAEAKSPAGVLIPESVQQDKPAEGQVLAVGIQAYELVKVGEDIAFGRYAGAEFPLNGETLLLMNVDEVLGTLRDEVEPKTFSQEYVEGWNDRANDLVKEGLWDGKGLSPIIGKA